MGGCIGESRRYFQKNTIAVAQAAQVLLRKTWRADHPAFVDCLGDRQVHVLGPSGHQHPALGTMGLCDRVVSGDTSPCGHTYLHIAGHKTAIKLLWAAYEREYLTEGDQGCPLLHRTAS